MNKTRLVIEALKRLQEVPGKTKHLPTLRCSFLSHSVLHFRYSVSLRIHGSSVLICSSGSQDIEVVASQAVLEVSKLLKGLLFW